MRRSFLLIALAAGLNSHARDPAATNESRAATVRDSRPTPRDAPALPIAPPSRAPPPTPVPVPAPAALPMPRMQLPALQAPAPAKAAGSIATPMLVVVGNAGAIPALPASISTGALTASGLAGQPVAQLPASITTPGLQVSGAAP